MRAGREVKTFDDPDFWTPERYKLVADRLRRAADRIEAGEIDGVMMCAAHPDGAIEHFSTWFGVMYREGIGYAPVRLMGMVLTLARAVAQSVLPDSEDLPTVDKVPH